MTSLFLLVVMSAFYPLTSGVQGLPADNLTTSEMPCIFLSRPMRGSKQVQQARGFTVGVGIFDP